MKIGSKLVMFLGVLGLGLLTPVLAMATPHFILTPASENETLGQNFVVIMGVDSETEKVIGIDIQGTFDSAKLEIVSIEKASVPDDGYQFTFIPGQAIIHNDAGNFEATLPSVDSSVYTGAVAKHDLLKITFKPKATGVATLNYVCTAGSVADTNIINESGNDVVDCSANQSGSYTITDNGSVDPTPTSGSSDPVATPTPTSSELPETGAVENTVALMVFGLSGMMAAWYLKLI